MEEYIRSVTEQIRCVKAREGVARELSDHIEDQAAAYEAAGDAHEAAVGRAVREMGDPVEVGVELDRIHRPQIDFKLIGMTFAFSIAGFFVLCELNGLTEYPEYFLRQCVALALSFGVLAGMYFLDYSFIGRYAYGIGAFLTAAICVDAASAGKSGAVSAAFTMAYLYVPVYAGILYRLRGGGHGAVVWGVVAQMIIAALSYGFSTLYTALNVYLICTVLLLMAVWKSWFKVHKKAVTAVLLSGLLLLPAALLMVAVLCGSGYGFRAQRLSAWLNPQRYADGAGYVYLFIRDGLSSAKWIGAADRDPFAGDVLIGKPIPFLTEPFVLFQIVCSYGMLAGLAVVSALSAVVIRAWRIVRRQKNQLGFMVSAACFMALLVNCLEGVLINTGFFPVSSMQFPFVSYGACTSITYAALIGLLLSVYRNEKILTERPVERRLEVYSFAVVFRLRKKRNRR